MIFEVVPCQVHQVPLKAETLLSGLAAVDAAVPFDLLDSGRKGIHQNLLLEMEKGLESFLLELRIVGSVLIVATVDELAVLLLKMGLSIVVHYFEVLVRQSYPIWLVRMMRWTVVLAEHRIVREIRCRLISECS